jgi:beta-aspartyl-peptidase (threonine type)
VLVVEAARAAAVRHGIATCAADALVTEATGVAGARDERPRANRGCGRARCAGHVAAATSTGGVAGKRRGRVGDSAVIGAGTYADDRIGAGSATGPGEAIIRVCLVKRALELLGGGHDPTWIAEHALDEMRRRVGVAAGLILVDAAGRVGIAHTTEAMAAAWRSDTTGRTILTP